MFGKHVYKIVKDIVRSWKHLQRTKPAFEEFVLTMTGMLGFRHHHQEWCRRKSGLVEEKANTRNTEGSNHSEYPRIIQKFCPACHDRFFKIQLVNCMCLFG